MISTNYSSVIHTLSSTFQWLSSIMETITIPIKCTSHVIENWKIIVKSKSSKNQISIRFQWSHHCKTRDTFQFPAKFNCWLFMNRLFLVCQIVKEYEKTIFFSPIRWAQSSFHCFCWNFPWFLFLVSVIVVLTINCFFAYLQTCFGRISWLNAYTMLSCQWLMRRQSTRAKP